MGVVYHAQQTDPIRRDVALKLIKPEMDSKQVIARFEIERQALAMMNHANIARVLDAGTTAADLPYFVMELVDGVPVTRYCDSKRLTLRERIELFIPVCLAIQHAHQKGIIHRDIQAIECPREAAEPPSIRLRRSAELKDEGGIAARSIRPDCFIRQTIGKYISRSGSLVHVDGA